MRITIYFKLKDRNQAIKPNTFYHEQEMIASKRVSG